MNRARATDPATSHAAADAAESFIPHHHANIVDALYSKGPATIYEIARLTGIDHIAVARRMKEIERLGSVYRTADTRPSPQGRQCTVWAYQQPQAVFDLFDESEAKALPV